MPTLLDILVVVVIAVAAIGGWRIGGSLIACHVAGLLVGLVAGLWIAGLLSSSLSPVAHLLLGAVCVVSGLLLGGALGRYVGGLVGGALRGVGAGVLDRALGAGARGIVALVACWLVAALVTSFGPPRWVAAVSSSALLSVNGSTPVAGQVTEAIRRIAPADLAALVPASSDAQPDEQTVRSVDDRVSGSVFKVSTDGCGKVVTGTAFVAADGLVVTNAHVVRGADEISVATGSGDRAATPLVVDRRADLAVLRVEGMDAAPLTLAASDARNGTSAVVVGFPSGLPRTAISAVVVQRMPIPTPGLTDGLALHQAYRIRAAIRHGNSGSPLLDTGGRVIGVVNALSGADGQQGYATTLDELVPDLARAAGATTAVSTGRCA